MCIVVEVGTEKVRHILCKACFHNHNIQMFEVVKESLLANLLQTEAEMHLTLVHVFYFPVSQVQSGKFCLPQQEVSKLFSDQLCI